MVDLSPGRVATLDRPTVALAGNEVAGVTLQITGQAAGIRLADDSPLVASAAYEVLFAELDLRQPIIVRRTGRHLGIARVPVALRPLAPGDQGNWQLPSGPGRRTVWLDARLPAGQPVGEQDVRIELIDASGDAIADTSLRLQHRGIDLPPSPLDVAAIVRQDDLVRAWPMAFADIAAPSIRRDDPGRADAVAVLDAVHALARRVDLDVAFVDVSPRFPSGLSADDTTFWADYLALVGPWFDGDDASAWLPRPPGVGRAEASRRPDRWLDVIATFRERGWIDRTAALVEPAALAPLVDPASPVAATAALRLVSALARDDGPTLLVDVARARSEGTPPNVVTRAQGAIEFSRPGPVDRPGFLRFDAADVPIDAGWLAVARGAEAVLVDEAVGTSTGELDRWFYPGEAFDLDEPAVVGLAAMRARRARFDAALLQAAMATTGEAEVRRLARTVARPIVVPVLLRDTPGLDLHAGAASASDLIAGRRLATAAARGERLVLPSPTLEPRVTRVRWDLRQGPRFASDPTDRRSLVMRAEAVVRAPSEPEAEGMTASLPDLPAGWSPLAPAPPNSAAFEGGLFRVVSGATTELSQSITDTPQTLSVTDEYSGVSNAATLAAPAAKVLQFDKAPIIDGLLADWTTALTLADQSWIAFSNRRHSDDNGFDTQSPMTLISEDDISLLIGFRVPMSSSAASSSFVRRQLGRLWGEDAIAFTIRPVGYVQGDPAPGPWTHVTLKPNGLALVSRSTDGRAWGPAAIDLAYAATVDDDGQWRGELRLPWHALAEGADAPGRFRQGPLRPELVLFNAIHHDGATGRSSSWAGPIDQDRQTSITGALVLEQR
ncbi:MAG: hypothetical protein AAGI46_07320 [Planctomycetota bacterium]